jgi:2-hydroxychromene-2-carboxylate isomerase
MTPLRFWFDPISPYAWLAFERLPQALEGCSYSVEYRPILFAALLEHWGQLGPAEVEPKRQWLWRQVRWIATRHDLPFVPPAAHPFNPLLLSRLLLATCDAESSPNRWACETVLRQIWCSGTSAEAQETIEALTQQLQPRLDPQGEAVRQQLRHWSDQAISRQLFGVPTVEILGDGPLAGRLFWGQDSLELLAACLKGDPVALALPWDDPAPPLGRMRPRRPH